MKAIAVTVFEMGRAWFVRVTTDTGRTFDEGPWRTLWAANKCADIVRGRSVYP